MFDLEPDVARRRSAPTTEQEAPSPERATPRPMGMHDAASLLHLQRTAGNAGVVQMLAAQREAEGDEDHSPVHDVVGKGGGEPLDDSVRGDMESRFGQDFGDVRVHTDAQASASAESVGANAYTVGSDIVFKGGNYDASSDAGQRTIAHELSHVVQQRSGPVEGTDAPGGIKVSDPSDRFERAADATADQVMSGSGSAAATAGTAAAPAVQRDDDETQEDEIAQRVVQREDDETEDEDEMGAG